MVHELVRYMKSVNMHGEKIKVKNCVMLHLVGNISKEYTCDARTPECYTYFSIVVFFFFLGFSKKRREIDLGGRGVSSCI